MSHKYELGTVPPAGARDAVHVAIFAATSGWNLKPGDRVMVDPWNPRAVLGVIAGDTGAIGIVDPFLKGVVLSGTRFWVIMNPGTVVDLRHTWSHPALPPLDRVDTPARAMVSANVLASRDDEITELKKKIEQKDARIEDLESQLGYDDGCRGC